MVLLIAGATHTGKTQLAQNLLEKYHYPYLSMEHLKMGLIRSGNTGLTPQSPAESLTAYLWPIAQEIAKTAVESDQNLIIEGCYIPYDCLRGFGEDYLPSVKAVWIIFSEGYIDRHFDDILHYASAMERRQSADLDRAAFREENRKNLDACRAQELDYILIDDAYHVDYEL